MTNDEITEIEARCAAASPGPWTWRRGSNGQGYEDLTLVAKDGVVISGLGSHGSGDIGIDEEGDAPFIAHARTDLPAALAEVRRLRNIIKNAYEARASDGWLTPGTLRDMAAIANEETS